MGRVTRLPTGKGLTRAEWRLLCWVRLNSEPVPGGTAHVHARSGDPLSEGSCRRRARMGEQSYKEAVRGLKAKGALARGAEPGTGVVTVTMDRAVETFEADRDRCLEAFSPEAPDGAWDVAGTLVGGMTWPADEAYDRLAEACGMPRHRCEAALAWCVGRGLVSEEHGWSHGRTVVGWESRAALARKGPGGGGEGKV